VSHATRFSHAICRRPGPDIAQGLRAVDVGDPDPTQFAADHAAYVAALGAAGMAVTLLDPLPGFPDAMFVEDTAICLPEAAILMRPGAQSRAGEAAHMAPALRAFYGEALMTLEPPARIEGGDVLIAPEEVMVGLSARTDRAGVAALDAALSQIGHRLRVVDTPPGVLHFKTDCSLIDDETILSTDRLAASGCFAGYRVIAVAEGEEPVANAIRVNGDLLVPNGYPRTADLLASAGFPVKLMANAEAAKLDGGLSCLSLRFTPP